MIGLILTRVKFPHNLAATIRAASCFGADAVLYTGSRFTFADGERLPREERMKGYAHVHVEATERPFDWMARTEPPLRVVCVELVPTAAPLTHYTHPAGSVAYVFGPEDGHVSQAHRALCHEFVYVPARHCLNLSAAVNVVLAHRAMQRDEQWTPATTEARGVIDVPGWEGR